MKIEQVPVENITVHDNRRSVYNFDKLTKSIKEVGLINPITVTKDYTLVSGHHRLLACKYLGWTEIPARIIDVCELEARIIEIDENVMRYELCGIELSDALHKRKVAYLELHPETAKGVAGGKASGDSRRGERTTAPGAVVQTPSFVDDTSEKTGLAPRTVREHIQIAENLAEDVKDAIRDTPVAEQKKKLLTLSRLPHEEQREKVKELTAPQGPRPVRTPKPHESESRPVSGPEPAKRSSPVNLDGIFSALEQMETNVLLTLLGQVKSVLARRGEQVA